jgi:hypothetical protein
VLLIAAAACSVAARVACAADLPPRATSEWPPATAPTVVQPVPFWHISEVRGGLLYHEDSRLRRVFFNQDKYREHGIVDVTGEILFQRLQFDVGNPFLRFLLTPRPRIGASINTGKGTSQASAGFAWEYYVWRNIFMEFTFDVAVHNGYTGTAPLPPNNLRNLGCNPLLRISYWTGIDITRHWRLMAGIEHLDNFGLCKSNQMLSNLGVRAGYRF